jgi:hypothetical protein
LYCRSPTVFSLLHQPELLSSQSLLVPDAGATTSGCSHSSCDSFIRTTQHAKLLALIVPVRVLLGRMINHMSAISAFGTVNEISW